MTVVYTIGYEGTDIERFVTTLKLVGIERLADVRAVAISRKKGFSKRKLAERLQVEGIEYTHFKHLGDPKPGRDAARSGKLELFREIYANQLASEDAQKELTQLETMLKAQPTCMLCFERDPSDCHRRLIAVALKQNGINAFDLFGDNPSRYVRYAEKLPRNHLGQSASAA